MHTIGLDYDDTFTTDPDAWFGAMSLLKRKGFRIVGTTFRYAEEPIEDQRYHRLCDRVIYCARRSKQETAKLEGEEVDIWIDDMPQFVVSGLMPFRP